MEFKELDEDEQGEIEGIIKWSSMTIAADVQDALEDAINKQDFIDKASNSMDELAKEAIGTKKLLQSMSTRKDGCPPGTTNIDGRCIKK